MKYLTQNTLLFLLVSTLTAGCLAAQDPADSVRLFDNLGDRTRPVTTSSSLAQQYFDQGMQLSYAFGRRDAVASFREAQRRDPGCAMCFWGEAWALGPYINRPRMSARESSRAYEAMQQAKALAADATPVEKAFIEAMAQRYPAHPENADRRVRAKAYAEAMRDVTRQFPNDADAKALLGEAIMVQTARDYWTKDDQPKAGVAEALLALETAIENEADHPGACHLYIHAMESSAEPERAEDCADGIAQMIPGASHIQHMPYHVYIHIGRYGDAVRANKKARRMDQAARADSAVAIYPLHNLNTLRFAAIMDGQRAEALKAAQELTEINFSGADALQLLTLVRFGQWDDVLDGRGSADDPFIGAVIDYARGMAHLRSGRTDTAQARLDALTARAERVDPNRNVPTYPYSQTDMLDVAARHLRAELAAQRGDYRTAIGVLEEAVAIEDSFAYDDSEFWPVFSRHVLGAVLLEAGRPARAEAVYRRDLSDHPHNGWALRGLEQSLRGQGKQQAADAAGEQFKEAWRRSEVALPASRF